MFRMTVSDVFSIRGRGTVATGKIEEGTLRKGDEVTINGDRKVSVNGIEMFRKILEEANAGDNVGVLLADLDKDDIKAGDVLTTPGGPTDPLPSTPPDESYQQAMRNLGR